MFIKINEDGSVVASCSERGNGCEIEVNPSQPIELERLQYCRYADGELVYDEGLYERHMQELARIEEENEAVEHQAAANWRARQFLENRILKQTAAEVAKSGTSDEIISISPYLPEWAQGAYAVGDVVVYDGYPYRCAQAHNSAGNPAWNPKSAASLWAVYHGTTPETALPWVAPTGAHDAYKTGEMMIWTDGYIYKALSTMVYTPAQYAQGWTRVD